MMCKKLFYLVSVLLILSLACATNADVIVLGDFENGSLDGWTSPGTISIGTVGATTGSACVDVTGGGYWGLSWEAPYLLDLTTATTLSFDVTMRVSDFPDGTWTNPGEKIAINSDLGWREFAPTERINRDTGEPYGGTDWGTWSGDQNLTIVYDISGADWTGILSSTYLSVNIALNNNALNYAGIFHVDNIQIDGATIVPFPEPAEPTVPFSIGAIADITIGNDSQVGPTQNNNGSGMHARNIDDRRRVAFISYDISSLKGRGPVSNVVLNNFGHDGAGEVVDVYGVIEDLDNIDESVTWSTAPGVENDPNVPPLNTPISVEVLDLADLTGILTTFVAPEQGVRGSSETSTAMDDFINSDTDGIVTFMLVPSAEGVDVTIRTKENASGGTFLEGDVAPIANIIWVSDNKGYGTEPNLAADHGFVDLLRANGYLVDYKNEFEYIDGTQYWRTLDDDKVAELEAADLVIMSRNGDSGSYSTVADNEPNKWNAVTTPILNLSAYMARSNKWGWLNGTSTFRAKESMMQVIEPDHPVFAGVTIDPNGLVEVTSDQYYMDWVAGVTDAGNGIILATRPEDNLLSIVTWEAGQKYFDGSLYTAGGPRMLFIAGTGSGNNAPEYSPDGAYNLTADGETMFLNAVKYMLPVKPVDPGNDGLVVSYELENDLTDSSGNGYDGTMMGDPEFVEGVLGMALSFDGDGDYVDTGNTENLASWTISAWVMSPMAPVSDGGQSGPIHREANYQMNWNHGGAGWSGAVGMSAGGWYAASLGPLEADTWYHLVGTYDGEDLKAYKDGVLITVNSDPSGPAGSESNSLKLGKHARDAYFFTGTVDEVKVFNRALSEEEILYLAGL